MLRTRHLVIGGLVAVAVVLLVVIGKRQGWIHPTQAIEVTVEPVTRQTIVERISGSGKIYPQRDVKISPDVSGEIVELYVAEGDSVQAGQPLARIKPDIYQAMYERALAALNGAKANHLQAQASLTQAAAELERAQKNYQRSKLLFEQGVLSAAEWDVVESAYKTALANHEGARMHTEAALYNVKSAEASVKEALEDLRKTMLYAPMSGIVTRLNVERGERVLGTAQMEGTDMMHISDLRFMEAWIDVSENDVLRIEIGDSAEVELDAYPQMIFRASVVSIGKSAKSAGLGQTEQATQFQVKILIDNKANQKQLDSLNKRHPFLPGMTVTADILTQKATNVLAVPIQAVTLRSDTSEKANAGSKPTKRHEVVFTEKDGKAHMKRVTVGIQDAAYIEIRSGLTENESVITGPYSAVSRVLKDQDAVRVVSKEKLLKQSNGSASDN